MPELFSGMSLPYQDSIMRRKTSIITLAATLSLVACQGAENDINQTRANIAEAKTKARSSQSGNDLSKEKALENGRKKLLIQQRQGRVLTEEEERIVKAGKTGFYNSEKMEAQRRDRDKRLLEAEIKAKANHMKNRDEVPSYIKNAPESTAS